MEPFLFGIKEGAVVALALWVILSFRPFRDKKAYRASLGLSLLFLAFLSGAMLFGGVPEGAPEFLRNLAGYIFGILYLGSAAALYRESEEGGEGENSLRRIFYLILPLPLFVFFVLYFGTGMLGGVIYLRELARLKGLGTIAYVFAGSGFLITSALAVVVMKKVGFLSPRFLGFPQTLLLLGLILLFGGGTGDGLEFTLIPAVQSGVMKFVHDFVHQTFLLLMVPDHPILSVTAWNFIGFIFRETAGLWLSLLIFIVPLGVFLKRSLTAPVPVPEGIRQGPLRRKIIKDVKDRRWLRSLTIVLFMITVSVLWFQEKGEVGVSFYSPDPIPVTAEGGKIIIPISSPAWDLRDGMLHKFVTSLDGEDVRVLVMRKPDGTLAVGLDACEICPPRGYVQGENHLVCLYCRTPIALESLGSKGGCNPIPLDAVVTDREILIEVKDLRLKWEMVKTGKTKERLR